MSIKKKFLEEITFFGGVSFYLFLIILFLMSGEKNYAYQLILGLIIIFFLTFIIRLFYFKSRPEKIKYSSFIGKIDASSFPSVHSARITFLALLPIFSFSLHYILILLIIFIWLLTVYSRYYLRKHDTADLIGGIILGILAFLFASFI